jgi:RHS repeat-associated protein
MIARIIVALMTAMSFLPSLDASAASFGRIAGQSAVSPTGSAQYSIPIWTPPGIRGVEPHLALNYDSSSSYGLEGPGWQLTGLSYVTRCSRTYAQDAAPAAITLTLADAFCLDGNRLRLTSSESLTTYGEAGTTYQTEIASFSDVTANGTAGNGPSYFTVRAKDGRTYEYGNTTNSKILPTGTTTPYIWALDKVTDHAGNQMTFTYTQTAGSFVPASIQYTAPSGSTSFPYQVKFDYSPKSATDTKTFYLAGTQIQQTNQLSTITVTNAGTTLRVYKLLYTTSTGTARATLTSIQECGGSVGSDCLPATSVGYQSGSSGVANQTSSTGSGATNGNFFSADIDGDGKMDLVFAKTNSNGSYEWWVQLATASGFAAPINTGAATVGTTNVLIDHFNGRTSSQLLVPKSGTWYVYAYSAGSFTATSTGLPVAPGAVYSSADVDGDGLPDLVYVLTAFDFNARVQLNTGKGTSVAFATTPIVTAIPGAPSPCFPPYSVCPTYPAVALFGNNQFPYSSIKHYDFDGDGRQDLVLFYEMTQGAATTGTVVSLLSRGTGPFVVGNVVYNGENPGLPQVFPALWNDDACTDLVVDTTVYISRCDGVYGSTVTLPYSAFVALDWDGDGRTDLISETNGNWYVYQSQGEGYVTLTNPAGFSIGNGIPIVMDQNGDGLDDIAYCNPAASFALYYGLHNGAGVHPDLATSFKDGYGNLFSPSYGYLTQSGNLYLNFTDAVAGYQNYIGPLYVVSNAKVSDPTNAPSGTYQHTYSYYGAWLNLQGRGFSGFNDIGDLDSRNAVWDVKYYRRDFPYTGMHAQEQVFQPNSQSILAHETDNTFLDTILDSTPNNLRHFPYANQSTNTEYQVGGSSAGQGITAAVTHYTYDTSGNAITISTVVTDDDSASPYYTDTWTSTTVNTIAPDTSTWCLGLPTETMVTNSSTAPGGTAITRSVNYTPDYTNCRQTERVVAPGAAYQVTEVFGFDTTVGNLLTDTVTGVGMAARTITLGWGATGQFLTTIQNPLGQTVTLAHDPNSGLLTSQSDPNSSTSNPLATIWQYDDFARKTSESRPDGTSTTWTYNNCATSGCVNTNNEMTVIHTVLNVGGTTQSVENIYLDSLDRTLITSKTMLSGTFDRNEVQYDNLGRIHLQGAPCTFVGCATYWTTNTYDIFNRLTETQHPISATNSTLQTTSIVFTGLTTSVTDALNNVTKKYNLPSGLLARSQDAKGYYQNFTYDAFGSLLSVTDSASPSHTLSTATYKYGLQAFKTASTDVDLGARSYTVNPLGEVTAKSDAKSQNFSMTYDVLSRPLVRTEPDLTTTWTWGSAAASYNIGKLQSVMAASAAGTYSDTYTYDNKTRLSSKLSSNPGDRTYNYVWSYSPTTGLLSSLQYPVDISFILTLQYAYSNGILQSISSNSYTPTEVFWTADATNPRGQVTQETLGNGAVINRNFDAVTGWLGSVQAGAGGGAMLQNNSYAYDYDGNVTQRQDNNRGLTENFYYDPVNRLDHSALDGNLNLQMTYDAIGMGNIASRSDVAAGAAWTYDPVHIHQVTQAGGASNAYVYDANGNVTSRNGYAVTWSSYNYPTGVNSAGETVTFQYGPNRERWQEIYTGPNGVEKTNRAGKLFEVAIYGGLAHYRHYVYAGNELVAVDDRTTQASPLYYIVGDHQGGIASIENSANPGTNYVSESFTAFGMRRNGETWSGAVSAADETSIDGASRHGYTDQSVLGVHMYLNHMNGRVQDAITGRFLSPDPNVPDPGNTQSYNRYSYVNNNPLTYTDPTGFDDCGDDGCYSAPTESDSEFGGYNDDPNPGSSDPSPPEWSSGVSVANTMGGSATTDQNGCLYIATCYPGPGSWASGSTAGIGDPAGSNPGGQWVDYKGQETHSIINPDGTTAPYVDEGQEGADQISPLLVQAPRSDWISAGACATYLDCGFNYAGIGQSPAFLKYQTPMNIAAGVVIGSFALNPLAIAEESAAAASAGAAAQQFVRNLGAVGKAGTLSMSLFAESMGVLAPEGAAKAALELALRMGAATEVMQEAAEAAASFSQ